MKKIFKEGKPSIDEAENYFRNINWDIKRDVIIGFGDWLNFYFEPWNPDDFTWIDSEKKAYSTEELYEEFKKSYYHE